MNIVLTCFCLVVSQQNPVDPAPWGYLYQPAYSLDEKPRLPARPYVPQAGDIVLFSNHSLFWDTIFLMAGTTIPFHSGIVVEMPDGEFATLESGRNYNTPYVDIESVMPYFAEWKGQIWVRRRAVPLTAEQSARLTDFALQVNQRPYGLVRLGAQLTPLRSRGPLRTFFIGYPKGPRQKSFHCTEIVIEACVYAGLMDAKTARPPATYPRDLFFDRSWNLYLNRHLKLAPCWDPPALWTICPVE